MKLQLLTSAALMLLSVNPGALSSEEPRQLKGVAVTTGFDDEPIHAVQKEFEDELKFENLEDIDYSEDFDFDSEDLNSEDFKASEDGYEDSFSSEIDFSDLEHVSCSGLGENSCVRRTGCFWSVRTRNGRCMRGTVSDRCAGMTPSRCRRERNCHFNAHRRRCERGGDSSNPCNGLNHNHCFDRRECRWSNRRRQCERRSDVTEAY